MHWIGRKRSVETVLVGLVTEIVVVKQPGRARVVGWNGCGVYLLSSPHHGATEFASVLPSLLGALFLPAHPPIAPKSIARNTRSAHVVSRDGRG